MKMRSDRSSPAGSFRRRLPPALLLLATVTLIAGCCCDDVLEKAMARGYEVLFCDSDVKTSGKAGGAVDPSHIAGEGEFTVTSGHRFTLLKKQPANLKVSGGIAIETSSSTAAVRTSLSVNNQLIRLITDSAAAEKLAAINSGHWEVRRSEQSIQLGATPGKDDVIEFGYELIDPRPLPPTGVPLPEVAERRLGFQLEGEEWVIISGGNRDRCVPGALLSITAPKDQSDVNWTVQKGNPLRLSQAFLKNAKNQTRKESLLVEVFALSGKLVWSKTLVTVSLKNYELRKLPPLAIPTQDLPPQSYLLKIQAVHGATIDDVHRISLHVNP